MNSNRAESHVNVHLQSRFNEIIAFQIINFIWAESEHATLTSSKRTCASLEGNRTNADGLRNVKRLKYFMLLVGEVKFWQFFIFNSPRRQLPESSHKFPLNERQARSQRGLKNCFRCLKIFTNYKNRRYPVRQVFYDSSLCQRVIELLRERLKLKPEVGEMKGRTQSKSRQGNRAKLESTWSQKM